MYQMSTKIKHNRSLGGQKKSRIAEINEIASMKTL